MSFSSQISLFVKQGKNSPKKARDRTLIKLFGAIIEDSPVDTGRLRGNWQTNIGFANLSTKQRNAPAGQAPLKRAREEINSAEFKDEIYFTNNLPYAEAIENGHGGRTPGVMVAKNVLRFGQLMTREATRQRRKKK